MSTSSIKKRACHLCEAVCGLDIHLQDGEIVAIKGDKQDPLSQGHICPKAVALQDIHNDPERLKGPVKRVADGWQSISWDEAFELVTDKLTGIVAKHGNNAVGVYAGNPSVHNYGCLTHPSQFLGFIRTRNRFSATSVDQLPHQLMAYWLYGHQLMVPIPDIDRCDYFLMLGANPVASNGSMMTVPNFPKRLKALQQRGGKLCVIDPRKTETAERADEHLFIRPGSDAALLAAIVHIIFRNKLSKPGRLAEFTDGLDELPALFSDFNPEAVSKLTGITADDIERIAADFCAAERAVCYARMGCSTQEFGTLCQWLTQIINILTGNMDEPGGMMLSSPAVDMIGSGSGGLGKPGHYNRHQSRVSGLPEFGGELPAVCMAEEITTAGEGQIKAMVTIAGNPVLSTPSGQHLGDALQSLEFMVCVDPYINETTQHATVILPPTSPLEHDHYDLIFNHFAVHNTAKYSAAVFEKPDGSLHDWEIFTELGKHMARKLGLEPKPSIAPDQIVDMGLQMGEYDLSLEQLKQQTEGVDLGPLVSRMPERLATNDKRIQCIPEPMPADLQRLKAALKTNPDASLKMIGRRHVRSCNSWMHQYHRLIKGANRCTLLVHPKDAEQLGLHNEKQARVSSEAGVVLLPVEISDSMMPGVVSIPHGYGHNGENSQTSTANNHAGVSINDLIATDLIDPVSGNAIVNGVSVTISPQ